MAREKRDAKAVHAEAPRLLGLLKEAYCLRLIKEREFDCLYERLPPFYLEGTLLTSSTCNCSSAEMADRLQHFTFIMARATLSIGCCART